MSTAEPLTPHLPHTVPDRTRVWMPALFDADRRTVDPRLVWLAAAIPASLLTKTGTGHDETGRHEAW